MLKLLYDIVVCVLLCFVLFTHVPHRVASFIADPLFSTSGLQKRDSPRILISDSALSVQTKTFSLHSAFPELQKQRCGRYLRAAKLNPAAPPVLKGRSEPSIQNRLSQFQKPPSETLLPALRVVGPEKPLAYSA